MRAVMMALLFLAAVPRAMASESLDTREQAEQGDPWYQTELALMYHQGKGVSKDYQQAAKWYRLAAEQGFSKAQANLGVMYGEGQGVEKNYAEAAHWFRKAAEQGNSLAQHHLGLLYGTGKGVEQNYMEAYIWESLAAAAGNREAAKNREIAKSKLSDEELKTALRRESFLYLKIEQRKRNP